MIPPAPRGPRESRHHAPLRRLKARATASINHCLVGVLLVAAQVGTAQAGPARRMRNANLNDIWDVLAVLIRMLRVRAQNRLQTALTASGLYNILAQCVSTASGPHTATDQDARGDLIFGVTSRVPLLHGVSLENTAAQAENHHARAPSVLQASTDQPDLRPLQLRPARHALQANTVAGLDLHHARALCVRPASTDQPDLRLIQLRPAHYALQASTAYSHPLKSFKKPSLGQRPRVFVKTRA